MKTIGIIGAMPSELRDIRAALPESQIKAKCGFDYYTATVGQNRVVHVCSGIAKVNAAVCTQALIDHFTPDYLINAGIAGGMDPAVHVCDIVAASEVAPHDLDLHFLQDYPPYCGIYPCDATLIDLARRVCDQKGVTFHSGRIVSGEAFISDSAVKAAILARLHPYAVDMESSAVGHCAYLNQVPFLSLRCISDNADDQGAMSFDQFEQIAARRVAELVLEMAAQL